ncbi:MAG: hypothetical protein KDA51_16035 [Planctomycetales bacterium]|nr:hypothetical protein [Planctomycetales bacterium]
MKRFQLFEIEDQAWFPRRLRNYMTDFLRTIAEKFNLFEPVVPVLRDILAETGKKHIVDLASGGGGQWRTLLPQVQALMPDVRLTLTDLYPNTSAFEDLVEPSQGAVDYETRPISATSVPCELNGLRTMFLSMHHFRPSEAQAILENAVVHQAPIAVFEAQCRDFEHVIKFSMSPIFVLLLTPFIRPFSVLRLVFTYPIPIVPLVVGFDGVVSVLRTYSPEEMLQLAARADPSQKFLWTANTIKHRQQTILFLTGVPNRSTNSCHGPSILT